MKIVIGVIVALFVLAVALSGGGSNPNNSTTSGPGSATVYAEIAGETSCPALQASFDRAEATHKRGGSWGPIGSSYMETADARMRAIGCY